MISSARILSHALPGKFEWGAIPSAVRDMKQPNLQKPHWFVAYRLEEVRINSREGMPIIPGMIAFVRPVVVGQSG
jgi:hypothetical protein